jgi:hypothetical protein
VRFLTQGLLVFAAQLYAAALAAPLVRAAPPHPPQSRALRACTTAQMLRPLSFAQVISYHTHIPEYIKSYTWQARAACYARLRYAHSASGLPCVAQKLRR